MRLKSTKGLFAQIAAPVLYPMSFCLKQTVDRSLFSMAPGVSIKIKSR